MVETPEVIAKYWHAWIRLQFGNHTNHSIEKKEFLYQKYQGTATYLFSLPASNSRTRRYYSNC